VVRGRQAAGKLAIAGSAAEFVAAFGLLEDAATCVLRFIRSSATS
jgi:hypothetical protein